eukprot:gene8991-1090_t
MHFRFLIIFIILLCVFSKDLYEVLGVSKTATDREIKKAYKRLALKYHPDRNKGKNTQKQFIEVSQAYEILKNPQKRKQYDMYGSQEENQYDEEEQQTGESNPFGFSLTSMDFNLTFKIPLKYDEDEQLFHHKPKFREIDLIQFKSILENNYHFSHIPQFIYVFPTIGFCESCSKATRILDASKERLKGLAHFKMLGVESKHQISLKGLTKIPVVLFVLHGKISIFHINNSIKFDKFTNFVHENYPKVNVPILENSQDMEKFLNNDGISIILFSKYKEPTSIEKELYYNYKDYHSFAHVHVSSNSHWAFDEFIELSNSGLPSICIQTKNETNTEYQFVDSLNREGLIEVIRENGIEKIPLLKSNEMLIDNCYGIYCVIFSSEKKTDSSFLHKIFEFTKKIKALNYRIGIINSFQMLKNSLNFSNSNKILFILNLKSKEYLGYNGTDFSDKTLKEWFISIPKLKFTKFSTLNLHKN